MTEDNEIDKDMVELVKQETSELELKLRVLDHIIDALFPSRIRESIF